MFMQLAYKVFNKVSTLQLCTHTFIYIVYGITLPESHVFEVLSVVLVSYLACFLSNCKIVYM